MRIISMGTGPFAVPTFRSLVESSHEVVVVVTRPLPAVRTRGKSPENPMRTAAEECGLPILSPEDINQEASIKQLLSLRPDLLVVCDYGQILSSEALAVAPLGGINLHGSLLPKYRGAAPVQWAVLNGEQEAGVSVIHMTPRLDAGPCLVQRATPIEPDECADQLERRLAELGVSAVHEAIELLQEWDGQSTLGAIQDSQQATKAPRLKKSDGRIDWKKSAAAIRNQVRALKPWPGTFTTWTRPDGKDLRLILDQVSVRDLSEPAEPGTVIACSGSELLVATGEGALAIDSLQPAGKRVMPVQDFLRGQDLGVGAQFE